MTRSAEIPASTAPTAALSSRRAWLIGALGGLGALVASAIGRPLPVRAGTDGDVVLGGTNVVTSDVGTTTVYSTDATNGFGGINANGGAIHPTAGTDVGIFGTSYVGNGVLGMSHGGSGVYGSSTSSNGVVGSSTSATDSGVWGSNTGGGYGVAGSTGGATTAGVWGVNSSSGIGVRATSASGNALQVEGKASFSRSGRVNVAANASRVDVTVPGGLGPSSHVLATLQVYRGGVYVAACRPNYPTSGKVRIYLNKVASTTSSTPVAWFVFG
jgi:hypothetical protein